MKSDHTANPPKEPVASACARTTTRTWVHERARRPGPSRRPGRPLTRPAEIQDHGQHASPQLAGFRDVTWLLPTFCRNNPGTEREPRSVHHTVWQWCHTQRGSKGNYGWTVLRCLGSVVQDRLKQRSAASQLIGKDGHSLGSKEARVCSVKASHITHALSRISLAARQLFG